MRIAKNLLALFAVSLITDALAVAPSTSALAAGGALWVSSGTISGGNGTSCNAPGFNSIQDAIAAAAANSTIIVCTGTYTEQLTITKALTITAQGAVTVQLPATPANDTTSCAAAVLATIGGAGVQDGVSICGNVTVSMTGLTVDAAWPAGTCNDTLYGILVGGNATLKLTTSSIIAAGPQPINGCQGGNGIEIGQAGNSPNPGPATPDVVGHAALNNVTVSGYQKTGVKVSGKGSSLSANGVSVEGAGPQDQLAQNGVQISGNGTARIKNSTITGNECDDVAGGCGSNPDTDVQSVGLLLFGPAKRVSLQNSTISDNDIGIYNFDEGTVAPRSSQASFANDKLVQNRYEGMVFDQGNSRLLESTITGGNIGVLAFQYAGQVFGTVGVVSHVTISGVSKAAIDVDSDGASGDIEGMLTISNSHISGNPGPVLDNSANFIVIQNNNT